MIRVTFFTRAQKVLQVFLPALLVFSLLVAAPEAGLAQPSYTLSLISSDLTLPNKHLNHKSFKSPEQRYRYLEEIRTEAMRDGHLTFSVDSIREAGKHWIAYLRYGEPYSWAELRRGNLGDDILGQVRYRDKIFFQRSFNPSQVSGLFEHILDHCENNGYPFASVRLDSVQVTDKTIDAAIFLDKNKLIIIDSVSVRGTTQTHPTFFQNHLGLKPGMLYRERTIQKVDGILQDIAFIEPFRKTEVNFTENYTVVAVYANHKKASRFDGVIGIQPNDNTGKIGITGDVKLALQNTFKRGESISLNWKRLQSATQDIEVGFAYPYLFNTPFGANLSFSLYRRDTSFVQINAHIGAAYSFSGRSSVEVFFEPHQSNVISDVFVPADGLASSSAQLFGLKFSSSNLNYLLNPTRGYDLIIQGAAGNRSVKKKASAPVDDYAGIPSKSTQWSTAVQARTFIEITPRNTVMLGLNGALLESSALFRNEVHRIGGMKTLRGFDEESIFASTYGIFTVEYRFLLEKNSNVFAFFDGAWYESNIRGSYLRDTPYGFGLGVRFETGAGIFSLTYALGKQQNNPILLRTGKIHFGFASFF